MDWLISLGSKSGLPRYVSLICLMQASILLIPESIWLSLGIEGLQNLDRFPIFVQYYVHNTSFKNAMLVFWAISPVTFSINTFLFFQHINFQGYQAHLVRRRDRLRKLNKTSDYALVVGSLILVVGYIWSTGFHLKEPSILGNFVPAQSVIAMLFLHSAAITLLLPVAITVAITEIRTSLFQSGTTIETIPENETPVHEPIFRFGRFLSLFVITLVAAISMFFLHAQFGITFRTMKAIIAGAIVAIFVAMLIYRYK